MCINIQKELSNQDNKLPCFVIIRLIHLFGEIAIRHYHFLDENVYKELKRRNHILQNRKNKLNEKRKASHNTSVDSGQISSGQVRRIISLNILNKLFNCIITLE